ncbi:hypothetical protein ACIBG4_38125 [Nonomuraea sp. NPDC050383]
MPSAELLTGRIQATHEVINPGKPRRPGPVAGAWALVREPSRARRPTG